MINELSLVELESELATELPERSLMCRRRVHRRAVRHSHGQGGTSAGANNGSVANANSTDQVIFNPQIAIITGVNSASGTNGQQINAAPLIVQAGLDHNSNTNTQFGVPVNFQG